MRNISVPRIKLTLQLKKWRDRKEEGRPLTCPYISGPKNSFPYFSNPQCTSSRLFIAISNFRTLRRPGSHQHWNVTCRSEQHSLSTHKLALSRSPRSRCSLEQSKEPKEEFSEASLIFFFFFFAQLETQTESFLFFFFVSPSSFLHPHYLYPKSERLKGNQFHS